MSDQAITETAQNYTAGLIEGQNNRFAPSVAEFTSQARKRHEALELQSRPRLPAPVYRRGPLAPFEIAKQKALTQWGSYPVIEENISYDEFRKLSAAKQIPVGATWVAALATIYGPKPAP